MEAAVLSFLEGLSSTVFRLAAVCFVLVNGTAALAFVMSRSRRLVDAWVPRVLAADAVLLTAGLGVPLVAGLAKLGVRALATLVGGAPVAEP